MLNTGVNQVTDWLYEFVTSPVMFKDMSTDTIEQIADDLQYNLSVLPDLFGIDATDELYLQACKYASLVDDGFNTAENYSDSEISADFTDGDMQNDAYTALYQNLDMARWLVGYLLLELME